MDLQVPGVLQYMVIIWHFSFL